MEDCKDDIIDLLEVLGGLLAVCQETLSYVPAGQLGDPEATYFLVREAEAAKVRYEEKYEVFKDIVE